MAKTAEQRIEELESKLLKQQQVIDDINENFLKLEARMIVEMYRRSRNGSKERNSDWQDHVKAYNSGMYQEIVEGSIQKFGFRGE